MEGTRRYDRKNEREREGRMGEKERKSRLKDGCREDRKVARTQDLRMRDTELREKRKESQVGGKCKQGAMVYFNGVRGRRKTV